MNYENNADGSRSDVAEAGKQKEKRVPPSHMKMPTHKRGPWSQAEDNYLIQLVNEGGANNWVRISTMIQSRSPKQCRERYHQNLKPSLNHDPITPEEGLEIERLVGEMGKRWAEIARRLKGRSDNAVKNWWNGGLNRRKRLGGRRTEYNSQELALIDQHRQQNVQSYLHHRSHESDFGRGVNSLYASEFQQPSSYAAIPRPLDVQASNMYGQRPRPFDAPLHSPSGLSVEGAPSLVSDSSSSSARSPHMAGSPVSLPPLIGTAAERRRSSIPMLQLGTTSFASEDMQYSSSDHHESKQVPAELYQSENHRAPKFRESGYDGGAHVRFQQRTLPPPSYHHQQSSEGKRPSQGILSQMPLPNFDLRTLNAPGLAKPVREYGQPQVLNTPEDHSPALSRSPEHSSYENKAVFYGNGQVERIEQARQQPPPSPSRDDRDSRMSFSTVLS